MGNVIALCPNDHALADHDLISRERLLEIVDQRIKKVEESQND